MFCITPLTIHGPAMNYILSWTIFLVAGQTVKKCVDVIAFVCLAILLSCDVMVECIRSFQFFSKGQTLVYLENIFSHKDISFSPFISSPLFIKK